MHHHNVDSFLMKNRRFNPTEIVQLLHPPMIKRFERSCQKKKKIANHKSASRLHVINLGLDYYNSNHKSKMLACRSGRFQARIKCYLNSIVARLSVIDWCVKSKKLMCAHSARLISSAHAMLTQLLGRKEISVIPLEILIWRSDLIWF